MGAYNYLKSQVHILLYYVCLLNIGLDGRLTRVDGEIPVDSDGNPSIRRDGSRIIDGPQFYLHLCFGKSNEKTKLDQTAPLKICFLCGDFQDSMIYFKVLEM